MKGLSPMVGLMALASLSASKPLVDPSTYTIRSRDDYKARVITGGGPAKGKGEKRRAKRNGERWT